MDEVIIDVPYLQARDIPRQDMRIEDVYIDQDLFDYTYRHALGDSEVKGTLRVVLRSNHYLVLVQPMTWFAPTSERLEFPNTKATVYSIPTDDGTITRAALEWLRKHIKYKLQHANTLEEEEAQRNASGRYKEEEVTHLIWEDAHIDLAARVASRHVWRDMLFRFSGEI